MRRAVLALAFLTSPALAQQPPSAAERFATEWSALDASINAASLQRVHVVEAAKAMIQQEQAERAELDYWRKWFAGEKAAWGVPKP